MRPILLSAISISFVLTLAACTSTPTATRNPTTSPTDTPTILHTPAPAPTATVTHTPTPTPKLTLVPTPKPTLAATPMPPPTVAATPPSAPTPTLLSEGQPRPLGKVDTIADHDCVQRDSFGGRCLDLIVTCPGINDAVVKVRVTGIGTRGTVVLTTGSNGGGWYRAGGEAVEGRDNINGMMDALLADGYKLVEVAWKSPGVWEGPGGTISLACRPATAVRWVYDNFYEGALGALYVAQGNSGGSAQIAFSLAYYGLDDILDLANLGGGPPPCPISTEGLLNRADQIHCLVGGQLWGESTEPMLFGNPQLHYPDTAVRFFIGEQEPNTDDIMKSATAYHDHISSAKSMLIVPNTGHGIHRTVEGTAALIASIREAAATPP